MKSVGTGKSSKNIDAEASQPSAGGEPSRSKLLTAGYPLGESDRLKLGGFLEVCHFCAKRIANNSDVYMYGDLRAFCSAECRNHQIARDKSAVGNRANSTEKK
ncbi:hypothetical protein C2S52_021143 [Perilla frutescens var. hirtella]|nr:hypothetical protein C2S52_021143 [Perilla frutescens var. hirtella]KAH6808378.1 hypothetical protein C2S51_029486 [Perilla frutescens var. frutescens]